MHVLTYSPNETQTRGWRVEWRSLTMAVTDIGFDKCCYLCSISEKKLLHCAGRLRIEVCI